MPNSIMRLHRVHEPEDPSEYDDGLIRETSAKLRGESGLSIIDSCISDEDNVRLQFFQASLFATLMEDAITEIRLLEECNNELRILKTMTDMHLLILKKYNVTRPHNPDELADIDHKNLGCDKYKLNKLVADRNIANTIFVSTYLDLAIYKRFDTLTNYNKSILDTDTYRAFLAEDTMNNKMKRRELLKQVRQQRNHIKSVTYDTDQTIEILKGQLEDATLVSEARSRYMDNWQVARTEQNTQTIDDKEAGPSQIIKYYRQRHDHEARVHSEIEILTNIRINETLEEVEKWMNKYDKDIESIDLKIQLKKNDYNSQIAKRIEMEELYEKHDIEMKDWVKFTTDREIERLYRLKMNTAAIVVQAWWRGLLVRLELGPFKPSKRKGKPADKKKKK
ncbi:unnamed protein product [Arctia plantaginis]|uniref:Dynein regulatory complex protein 9 n=1 Tax=Arctia plantaginis TaxID=874455 RepID=A0A8S1AQH1_ARCPL|nr:unnamed protein product [Arctia plantaginis]CAB3248709.1 unnamed protein product [Arctia plantaginis]